MTIDYSQKGKVSLTMPEYINDVILETPDILLKGTSTTSVASHLLTTRDDVEPLPTDEATLFHHLLAKLLYLANQTHPDLLLAISFLTTQVQSPDKDDMKKLG